MEHSASGAAIEALEREHVELKWSNRKISGMSQSEKTQMIADLGAKAFEARVWAEQDEAPGRQ